jgi:hypothetical protein
MTDKRDDVTKKPQIEMARSPGTDLKYFRRKKMRKNWRFLLKTKLNYAKF